MKLLLLCLSLLALSSFGACGVVVNSSLHTLTEEFRYEGKGDHIYYIMNYTYGSYCYLVEGGDLHKGEEYCAVDVGDKDGEPYWVVHKSSQKSAFNCGIQCVVLHTVQNAITSVVALTTQQDTNINLYAKTANSFCYLVGARGWYSENEICSINDKDGEWWLEAKSKERHYACAAQCAIIKDPSIMVIMEDVHIVKGKGDGTKNLVMNGDDGFCFITRGREWQSKGERCHVTVSHGQWVMNYESKEKNFECGARCVTLFQVLDTTQ